MMALIGDGIDRVRVFALPAGMGGDGGAVHEPVHALATWRSWHADKVHHVYVNGRLAGITHDRGQRRLVIGLLSSRTAPLRIEVFAVQPGEAHLSFGEKLSAGAAQGRVELGWLRRMGLPFEGTARVYGNGGAGPIDYASPVSGALVIWPTWQDQGGFGLSRFGRSDFGYDGSAAVGFGRGLFGAGEFGFDADAMQWTSEELADGIYRFGVKIVDASGNASPPVETSEITIIRNVERAGSIAVGSFEKTTGELELEIELAG